MIPTLPEPLYTPATLTTYLAKVKANALQYFWDRIDQTPGYGPWGDCWIWTGHRDDFGYGRPHKHGMFTRMHRFSYELHYGPILNETLLVRHRCDLPPCVNPLHLLLGTKLDNARDRDERGRSGTVGEKNHKAKLTDSQVIEIRQRWTGAYGQASELMKEFGIKAPSLYGILSGTAWKHLDPNHAPPNLRDLIKPPTPSCSTCGSTEGSMIKGLCARHYDAHLRSKRPNYRPRPKRPDACASCGTTESPSWAHGLCQKCYHHKWYLEHKRHV